MGSVQRGKLGQPSKILPTVLVVGTNTVVEEGVKGVLNLVKRPSGQRATWKTGTAK